MGQVESAEALPATAVAHLMTAPGRFELVEMPLPTIGAGAVLVRVEACGVCGTDLHYSETHLPAERYPTLLGHEVVGRVAAIGEGGATDGRGRQLQVGHRVATTGGGSGGRPCGRCYQCLALGQHEHCTGGSQYANANDFPYLSGGFAEYIYLPRPEVTVFVSELPVESLVMLEPLSIAVKAVERGRVILGQTAVVQGAGAIGLLTALCARQAGASRVVMIGGPASRLDLADRMGLADTIDIAESSPTERAGRVSELTGGRGADVVFEAAGVPAALNEALQLTRSGGTVVELGHFVERGVQVSISPTSLLRRDLNLVGSFASTFRHYLRALTLLESGVFDLISEVVSHQLPLHRLPDAIGALGAGGYRLDGDDVMKIIIRPRKERR